MTRRELEIYLTQQQRVFCYEFMKDFNVWRSYQRAGYKSKYRETASIVRNLPHVDAYIELLVAERIRDIKIDADTVLREIYHVAMSRMTDYAKWKNGRVLLVRSEELTAEQAAAVESVKETRNGVELKLHSKLQALRMLGDHLKLFTEEAAPDQSAREVAEEIKNELDMLFDSVPSKPEKETA